MVEDAVSAPKSDAARPDDTRASYLSGQQALFWLLAALSLAGYLGLLLWFPLRPYFNRSPSPDLRSLAPSLPGALAYALLLSALFGLNMLAYRWVRRRRVTLSPASILLTSALFCIPLLFAFPINATDIYRYFIRGRISSVHQENPFEVPAATLVDEPFLPLAGEWAGETSPYGPLWELTAGSVTGVFSDDLWSALLLFKGLAAAAFLVAAGLIWFSLKESDAAERAGMTLLWAWNPALLLIFAMDGHNDALMIMWLLLGWWVMGHGRPQLGFALMLFAPLVKPIALLTLPYFFLSVWLRLPTVQSRVRFLLVSFLAGVGLAWMAFAPFGSPLTLATRLISEAGSGGGFSPLALLILLARGLTFNPSIRPVTSVATILFLLLAAWLLWRVWIGRSPLRSAADIFAGYIVQAFRFRIWYASWPFAWLLLDHGRADRLQRSSGPRLAAGLTFLYTSQMSVIVYGQVRTELLGSSQLLAHILGVTVTFLLPFLTGLAVAAYNARSRAPHTEK